MQFSTDTLAHLQQLQEKPLDEAQAAAIGYVYVAIYKDQDLHSHESLPFAPTSGSDFLSWHSQQIYIARALGHTEICIHRHLYEAGRKYTPAPDTVVSCQKRFRTGDWMPAGIYDAIQMFSEEMPS